MTDGIHFSLIVAMAQNGVIGKDGALPWRMRDDLKWFKEITMGKPIIMGRTTYDDLGRALPGRTNIVLTRRALDAPDGVIMAPDLDTALTAGAEAARAAGGNEVCIIGGAHVYAQMMDRVQTMYITRIAADIDGDRTFTRPDPADGWDIHTLHQITADARNEYDARIERWVRTPSANAVPLIAL